MCALGDEEQLRLATPELTHVLVELMFALGDAGVAAAPTHRSCRTLSKMRLLCSLGNTGATVASPYRSSRACLMMELLYYTQC